MTEPLPVTIVTGWQATTTASLINHLVGSMDGRRVAVVGSRAAAATPPAFFVETEAEISERSAGCSCCALRSDLVRIVGNLSGRTLRPDWVLVEAAGWTDPILTAQTFHTDPGLADATRLDGIVAVVDGTATGARLLSGMVAWPDELAADQVAVADRIVVSGAQSMTYEALAATAAAASAANQLAEVVAGDDQVGGITSDELIGLEAFGAHGAARCEHRSHRLSSEAPAGSTAIVVEAAGALDKDRFERWVAALHQPADARLLRLEGVLAMRGADRHLLCQGVGNVLNRWRGRRLAPKEARVSRLVVAGRNLDHQALQASLADCVST